MNSYTSERFVSREFLENAAVIPSVDCFIKNAMIIDYLNHAGFGFDIGAIKYSFQIFDWETEPSESNKLFHYIINRCMLDQVRYYKLIINHEGCWR